MPTLNLKNRPQPKSRRSSQRNTEMLLQCLAEERIIPDHLTGEIRGRSGKVLKERINFYGYRQVQVTIGHAVYWFYVHKIIFISKRGVPPPDFEIDHIDDNKLNCSYKNLQCIHWLENMAKTRIKEPAPIPAF